MAYLVDGYGPDSIRNLCAAIPRYDTTISDWESAFLEVLGVSLAELLADYQDYYPTCSLAQFRARLWGCDGDPDYTFTQNDRSFVVESDCADPRATNAYFGKRGDATITRLVHFPTDAWILLRATAEGPSGKGAIVTTQQCASCESDPQIIREGDNSGNIYKYRPGLHQVTVFFDKRDAVQLTMTKLP